MSWKLWKLSWDLPWILAWNLARYLTRALAWDLDGNLTGDHRHLAGALPGSLTWIWDWVNARDIRASWDTTGYKPTIPIRYLDAQFLVLFCSTDGAHFRS